MITIFFFQLQQGRQQAPTARSNPDTHRGAEQRSRTDAQNPPELLLFAAWWFGEEERCADPSVPNRANPAQFQTRKRSERSRRSLLCIREGLCSIHHVCAGKTAKQRNMHSVENHICPLVLLSPPSHAARWAPHEPAERQQGCPKSPKAT